MVRSDDRGRRGSAPVRNRAARRDAGRARARSRTSADRRPPRPTRRGAARRRSVVDGNDCSGCSAPTRTSVRTSSSGANTSRPNEPARCTTSAPRLDRRRDRVRAAAMARSGVATSTSAAPRATSDTSDASAPSTWPRPRSTAASGARPRRRTAVQPWSIRPSVIVVPARPGPISASVRFRRRIAFQPALLREDASDKVTPASRTPSHVASASTRLGRDVAQRRQHEPPLPHARVRNREVGVVERHVVDEQARRRRACADPNARPRARRELLDPLATAQQRMRIEIGLDRDDRVEVRVLRRAADRCGLVDARHRDHATPGHRAERVDRELQMREPVAQVRAEREVRASTAGSTRAHRSMRTATWSTSAAPAGRSLRTSTTTPTRGSARHTSAMRVASRSSSW